MYIDCICSVYMYIVNVVYTERKYISVDNDRGIDIRIDNID